MTFTVKAPLVSKHDEYDCRTFVMMNKTIFFRNFMTRMMLAMFTVSEDSPTPALQPITCIMVTMVQK